MRVFLDTNVLASAFATRGLCEDVLRLVLAEHELVVGDVVIRELRRVLRTKFRVPAPTRKALEDFLKEQVFVPRPRDIPRVVTQDPDDDAVLASAVAGKADILVTGDKDLLSLGREAPLPIVTARAFWELAKKSPPTPHGA